LTELRRQLVGIFQKRGLRTLEEPVRLASGDLSRYFVDCKRALSQGRHLQQAADAVIELVAEKGIEFDAVGGLTMGADSIAHSVSMLTDTEWFSVRKVEKDRGTRQRIEGAALGPAREVLLVDDVVTRGGSIFDAMEAIRQTGANVAAAVSLVDRGEFGSELFAREGIPYWALVTYEDLGIPAVGTE
jgi:orotate phosphoribosyltransferase